jgi:hypothetical protein
VLDDEIDSARGILGRMADLSSNARLAKTKVDKGRKRTGTGNCRQIQFSFVLYFKLIVPGVRVRAPELLSVFYKLSLLSVTELHAANFS